MYDRGATDPEKGPEVSSGRGWERMPTRGLRVRSVPRWAEESSLSPSRTNPEPCAVAEAPLTASGTCRRAAMRLRRLCAEAETARAASAGGRAERRQAAAMHDTQAQRRLRAAVLLEVCMTSTLTWRSHG